MTGFFLNRPFGSVEPPLRLDCLPLSEDETLRSSLPLVARRRSSSAASTAVRLVVRAAVSVLVSRSPHHRWRRGVEERVLLFYVPGLVLASFPAVAPVADKKPEAEGINLHAGLEADTKVSEIHLVLVGMRQEEAQMAGDGE